MKEIYGNLWDWWEDYDAVVITTNGYITKKGEAVMGRGIAKEAKDRFPALPKFLGDQLKQKGNITLLYPMLFAPHIITLPVKPQYGPNSEMGWQAKADIDLIVQSIHRMNDIYAPLYGSILMPRPGCGNGGLKWEDVKPVIEPLLSDKYTVISFEEYE